MCPICGGTCGGVGNTLLALGVPFLAVTYWKMKDSVRKMVHKLKK